MAFRVCGVVDAAVVMLCVVCVSACVCVCEGGKERE